VSARGVVRAGSDSILYAPFEGIVRTIHFREGAAVGAGEAVVSLDGVNTEQRLREEEASLERDRAALETEIAAFERMQRLPLPQEFWHVEEELSIVREKVGHAKLEVVRAENMHANGLISQQELERARLSLSINQGEEEKNTEKLRMLEMGIEDSVVKEFAARVRAVRAAIDSREVVIYGLRQHLALHEIRSPEAGEVTLLRKRRPGQPVQAGEEVARIRHGAELEADLHVGDNKIHLIRTGQRVRLKTAAFNPLLHGYIEGVVDRVPLDAEEMSAPGTTTPPESRFRVMAAVVSSPEPLILGTSVEAEIILRRVPLWRLLLPESLEQQETPQPASTPASSPG
jgi:multidrug resistance efflux pump